jgi:S1-C subfamily serine protease
MLCLFGSAALAKPAPAELSRAAPPLPTAALGDGRRELLGGAPDARDAIARALEFTVTIEADGVYGSGILMAPDEGLVITAHHVVEEMRNPQVAFADGKSYPAHVLDVDRTLDLALLRIAKQQRPAPTVGDATLLRPGDEVYAIGNPRRLGFTVSRGIVSFVGRPMDGARYVQTDLPINDGNSGGPVVNARGELVGMMSFILRRAQGISFALPVNYAAERFAPLRPADTAYLTRFRRWRGADAR